MGSKNIDLGRRLLGSSGISSTIRRNSELLEKAMGRKPKFPELREILQADLITSFSHMNPNLPLDEIVGNIILHGIAERLELDKRRIMNQAYDLSLPVNDRPHGHALSIGGFNIKFALPLVPYFMQNGNHLKEVRDAHIKSALGRLFSNGNSIDIEAFSPIIRAFLDTSKREGAIPAIIRIRQSFFKRLDADHIPEIPTSSQLSRIADMLEALGKRGVNFWECPITDRISQQAHLRETKRQDGSAGRVLRFDGTDFRVEGSNKSISRLDIYKAMREKGVIPTIATLVFSLTVAPEIPHMGGIFWGRYAPELLKMQCRWLGIPDPMGLFLTTNPDGTFGSALGSTDLESGFFDTAARLLRKEDCRGANDDSGS